MGAGIFAVEIIQKSRMRYIDLFPAILASSTAVFICKFLGFSSFYSINAVNKFIDFNIIFYLLGTAILTGFVGKLFTGFYGKVTKFTGRDLHNRLLIKVIIGTIIASIGAWTINPELLGTSKKVIKAVFESDITVLSGNLSGNIGDYLPFFIILLLMMLFKLAANCITVGSGMSAGFTGPAAIIGMLFGSAVANFLNIPPGSANHHAFIAVGFSGLLASSMNIPIAAAIITIEIFGLQYGFPAGIAAVIGYQVNRRNTIYSYRFSETVENNESD